jgi:septum formation protein
MSSNKIVYLASSSPRRGELLRQLGVAYAPLEPAADEDAEALERPLRGEAATRYVQRVTALKLHAARQRLRRRGLPAGVVLCADTTVALGRRLLGKPADDADALAMLRALAGTSHRVLTAVAVATDDRVGQALSVSRVRMAPLDEAVLAGYVASGEPRGKAGGYAVQGRAAAFIEHISGSYSGIMGLPLFETAALLRDAGAL